MTIVKKCIDTFESKKYKKKMYPFKNQVFKYNGCCYTIIDVLKNIIELSDTSVTDTSVMNMYSDISNIFNFEKFYEEPQMTIDTKIITILFTEKIRNQWFYDQYFLELQRLKYNVSFQILSIGDADITKYINDYTPYSYVHVIDGFIKEDDISLFNSIDSAFTNKLIVVLNAMYDKEIIEKNVTDLKGLFFISNKETMQEFTETTLS